MTMFARVQQTAMLSSSATIRPAPNVLRRCCGGGSGECAGCRKKRLERQASSGTLRRQETAKQPSNEEKMKEGAKKVGEAFLETDVGKDIRKQAEDLGKDFVSGLAGKIITGTAAAGVLSYLIAKNAELPIGVPDIPLDVVRPGLKLGITYEGPVRSPTKAMLTFSFSPGAPASKRKGPTEKERFRSETARMAKEMSEFREGLKSPEQKAAEDEAFQRAYWGGMNKYGLRPLAIPGLGPEKEEEGTVRRQAAEPVSTGSAKAPPIVSDVLSDSGAPLPSAVQSDLANRFGHDFSRVRVHTDSRSAASAMAVNARAYTVGSRIVFGSGQLSTSGEGLRLLAHELAHVVQNETANAGGGSGGLRIGSVNDPLEHAADAAADRVLAGDAHASVHRNARTDR